MRNVSWFGGVFCGAVLLGIIGVVRMATGQCCGGGGGYSYAAPPTNCAPAGCGVSTNGTAAVTNAVPRAVEPTPGASAGSAK